jgi:3-phosphoshikimate 1-carboxyvinyltransferase
MSNVSVEPPRRLRGSIAIPGDKSISHRAVIFNSLAQGEASIHNFLAGADCLRSIACMQALGVAISREQSTLRVRGVGLRGLREPGDVLDCGNSGTSLRLLAGLLAGQPFFSVLTGDSSLRSRPQRRIVEPLRALGAQFDGRDHGDRAPLAIRGAQLRGGAYALPLASAQVKSALLLAALTGEGQLRLSGRIDSRDHTERMLRAMGTDLRLEAGELVLSPPASSEGLAPLSLTVPGDPSSAAFWWVAAAIHPDAELTTTGVCLNETRSGALDVLRAMGADLQIANQGWSGAEPVADVTVRSSHLHGTTIDGPLIPRLIDEIPVLAVAAALAEGETLVRDAQELRAKETDRIATVTGGLAVLGVQAEARADGMHIVGQGKPRLRGGGVLASHGDHRLAMAWAVAALVAEGATTVAGIDAVDVSYPGFWETLASLVG